uniref:Amino acid permease/ SLC12A domain-containing protein n=1 Tax=Ciona savignyi TaxID=51511 RepID=H2ZPS5_CIOSA
IEREGFITMVAEDNLGQAEDIDASSNDEGSETQADNEEFKLLRKIGLAGGISIIVGIMIGSGIFISPTGILRLSGGSVGVSLMIWVFCGILTILAALCLCELGMMFPESGGINTYLLKTYGSGLAFLHAWAYCLFIIPGKGAIQGLALGEYISRPFYPSCDPPQIIIQLIAVSLTLTVVTINCYSVKIAARLGIFFTFAKITALIIMSVSAFVYVANDSTVADENFSNAFDISNPVYGTVATVGVAEISLAIYQGLFPYAGFINLNVITEEIKRPERNLPFSIIFGVTFVLGVYIVVNCAYFLVLSPTEMLQSFSVALTLADRTITTWSWVIPLGVSLSVLGNLNNSSLANGRIAFVASQRNLLPQIFSMIQVTFLTPTPALSLNLILMIIFLFPSNIDSLIQGTQFMEWFFIGLSTLGLIICRWTHKDTPRPFKIPLIIPVIVTLISAFLVVTPLVFDPDPFILYATLFTVGGLLFYFPLVFFNLKIPYVDYITIFFQELLNVSPPLSMEDNV